MNKENLNSSSEISHINGIVITKSNSDRFKKRLKKAIEEQLKAELTLSSCGDLFAKVCGQKNDFELQALLEKLWSNNNNQNFNKSNSEINGNDIHGNNIENNIEENPLINALSVVDKRDIHKRLIENQFNDLMNKYSYEIKFSDQTINNIKQKAQVVKDLINSYMSENDGISNIKGIYFVREKTIGSQSSYFEIDLINSGEIKYLYINDKQTEVSDWCNGDDRRFLIKLRDKVVENTFNCQLLANELMTIFNINYDERYAVFINERWNNYFAIPYYSMAKENFMVIDTEEAKKVQLLPLEAYVNNKKKTVGVENEDWYTYTGKVSEKIYENILDAKRNCADGETIVQVLYPTENPNVILTTFYISKEGEKMIMCGYRDMLANIQEENSIENKVYSSYSDYMYFRGLMFGRLIKAFINKPILHGVNESGAQSYMTGFKEMRTKMQARKPHFAKIGLFRN